jgi:hypothetical protein
VGAQLLLLQLQSTGTIVGRTMRRTFPIHMPLDGAGSCESRADAAAVLLGACCCREVRNECDNQRGYRGALNTDCEYSSTRGLRDCLREARM